MATPTIPEMATLVLLAGRKGAGKDSAALALQNGPHTYAAVAFADPLKEVAQILFGFSHAQLHQPDLKERVDLRHGLSPREVLQKLGTEVLRERLPEVLPLRESIFISVARRRIRELLNQHVPVVVTDVRFDDEADMALGLGGVLISIQRSSEEPPPVGPVHASERGLRIMPHAILVNDGTLEQLQQALVLILLKLGPRPLVPITPLTLRASSIPTPPHAAAAQ